MEFECIEVEPRPSFSCSVAMETDAIMEGIRTVQDNPPSLQHVLYPVLMRLVAEVRATLAGAGTDPAWTLEGELRRAMVLPDVRESAYIDRGCVRFDPDASKDDFLFSTLGLYETILASLTHRRTMDSIVAEAEQAAAALMAAPVTQLKRPCEDAVIQEQPAKNSRRLPKHADQLLKKWLIAHTAHPFPDDDEKDELALRTGLTHRQLNNYFINARRRFLKTIKAGSR
eukprot:m.61363 g.61363  ORF g.61363 m.61363 type:complete len:228 (+) comp7072_c0_seq1:323-1006(+)